MPIVGESSGAPGNQRDAQRAGDRRSIACMSGIRGECQSCGARVADEKFCTACGAQVPEVTAGAVVAGAAPPPSSGMADKKVLLIAGAGVAVIALLAGGAVVAFGGGSDATTGGSNVIPVGTASPSASSGSADMKTAPATVETVTATATATATVTEQAPPPQYPVETQPRYTTPAASSPDFSGFWTGGMRGDYSTYSVQLDLDQSSSGKVSGTVTSSNLTDNTTGSWYTSGYISGNRVVLTPDSWISQPNSTWRRDTITIIDNDGTLTAQFVDPREPNDVWGTTTLS